MNCETNVIFAVITTFQTLEFGVSQKCLLCLLNSECVCVSVMPETTARWINWVNMLSPGTLGSAACLSVSLWVDESLTVLLQAEIDVCACVWYNRLIILWPTDYSGRVKTQTCACSVLLILEEASSYCSAFLCLCFYVSRGDVCSFFSW